MNASGVWVLSGVYLAVHVCSAVLSVIAPHNISKERKWNDSGIVLSWRTLGHSLLYWEPIEQSQNTKLEHFWHKQ